VNKYRESLRNSFNYISSFPLISPIRYSLIICSHLYCSLNNQGTVNAPLAMTVLWSLVRSQVHRIV